MSLKGSVALKVRRVVSSEAVALAAQLVVETGVVRALISAIARVLYVAHQDLSSVMMAALQLEQWSVVWVEDSAPSARETVVLVDVARHEECYSKGL